DFVRDVVEFDLLVIALDGEDFTENRLEADMLLALGGADVGLEEFRVGIRLQLDHVRWRDDFLDLAEVDTFCGSRWHFMLSFFGAGPPAAPVFSLNNTSQPRRVHDVLAKTITAIYYRIKFVKNSRLSRG